MTLQEKRQLAHGSVARVDKLRSDGVSPRVACKRVGINYWTYKYHKTRLNKEVDEITSDPQPKVTFTTLPETKRKYNKTGNYKKTTGKVALVIGSPSDIGALLNEYL